MQLNVHIVLTFVSFTANVIFGSIVLAINPSARLNRIYSLFTFCTAYWGLMKLGQAFSLSAELAAFHYAMSGPGWCLLPAVYIHFVAVFTRRKLLGGRRGLAAMYILCVTFAALLWKEGAMLDGMAPSPWGFTHVPGPLYRFLFQPFFLGSFAYIFIVLVRFARRAKTRSDRVKGVLLTIGPLVPVVGGGTTNMLLPSLGIHVFELALPLTTANVAIVGYAMVRYKLLTITVEYAASTIINTMGDSLMVLDIDGTIRLTNPATLRLLGCEMGEIVGRHVDRVVGNGMFERIRMDLAAKGSLLVTEVEYLSARGEAISVSLSISALKDEAGSTVGYVCVAKDIRELRKLISEIEEAKRELEMLAITDPLTGLFNKRCLSLRLKEEILRSRRYGSPFSVAMIDLDNFKLINDRHGHEEGDRMLRLLAQSIKATTRVSDTVARYGGDEFVVVLPEASKESALQTAERLRKALVETSIQENYDFVTASIGVSTFNPPAEGISEDLLLRLADAALYRAKSSWRNIVVHSDDG